MLQPQYITIGVAARHFGCQAWQVRRLFERGLLPQAARVGAYRVIAISDLPAVGKALRHAGYLMRRPAWAYSSAAVFVSPSTPCLLAT
jgi:hypothetical protein